MKKSTIKSLEAEIKALKSKNERLHKEVYDAETQQEVLKNSMNNMSEHINSLEECKIDYIQAFKHSRSIEKTKMDLTLTGMSTLLNLMEKHFDTLNKEAGRL